MTVGGGERGGSAKEDRDVTLDHAMGMLADGDRSAFDEVYRQTKKTVYYLALSYVRERMLAEDVMQATYLKVLTRAGQYRRGSNAAAWIARIARNEALDVLRRRRREVSVDERENPVPFGVNEVDDYGLLVDLARRILKREEFSVLMLAAAEGYKRREIAVILSMPLPTVTWHYSRAVQKMQRALAEKEMRGGSAMNRRELEHELYREAEEHVPDVYARVLREAERGDGGEVLVRTGRRWVFPAVLLAGLMVLLACILPFALRGGSGGLANLYISINPSVDFVVEDERVTGVRALNRDAAVVLADADVSFIGMTPEEAGVKFAQLSEAHRLITAQGIGVYATGENGEELARRVRERLTGEYGGVYPVEELAAADLDAILAAYDEDAMGDFEDYLERELSHLRKDFASRVRALLPTYEEDLAAVFAGSMTREQFNAKYLYLGEDCIFEDGDEEEEDLLEEFDELRRDIGRYGDDYIYDELYDEFLEAVEESYEDRFEDEDDDDDEDDEDD